jgi:soluble cytochrome b562
VALLSEELVFEPRWLQHVLAVNAGELRAMKPQLALLQLDSTVRSLRQGIATVEFEIEMYRDPMQDLDAAYAKARAWAQNTKASDYKAPSGVWAIDVQHYISYPCYCHNYVLGKVWASQVRKSLRRRFGTYASRRVGPFMAKHRGTGLLYTPDEQIVQITHRPLTCDDLIAELDRLAALLEAQIARATTA